jgi:hypothetical protein
MGVMFAVSTLQLHLKHLEDEDAALYQPTSLGHTPPVTGILAGLHARHSAHHDKGLNVYFSFFASLQPHGFWSSQAGVLTLAQPYVLYF